jgi:hypothetical protein
VLPLHSIGENARGAVRIVSAEDRFYSKDNFTEADPGGTGTGSSAICGV